jgi:hypothetical protein
MVTPKNPGEWVRVSGDPAKVHVCKVCRSNLVANGDTCQLCATAKVPFDTAAIDAMREEILKNTVDLILLSDSSKHYAQAERLARTLESLHGLELLVKAAYGNKT